MCSKQCTLPPIDMPHGLWGKMYLYKREMKRINIAGVLFTCVVDPFTLLSSTFPEKAVPYYPLTRLLFPLQPLPPVLPPEPSCQVPQKLTTLFPPSLPGIHVIIP